MNQMMTDEEIIRKSCRDLEMIWGVDSSEIAKIIHSFIERDIGCGTLYDRFNSPPPPIYIGPVKVKSLKEKLEEATMHEDCYFCIKRDICTKDVPKPCKYRYTEEERIADQASDRCGAVLNGTYLHPTFRKKKEDNEMKATSTQTFKDIIAVDFELQTFPNQDTQDKFIVSATNRDDIFAFEFDGPDLLQSCKMAGLFTGWEKDQRIRELEDANMVIKKNAANWSKENERIKENLNSQHEMIKELNQKNLELQEENKKLKQQLQQVERDKKRLTGGYVWLDGYYNCLVLKDYHQLKDKLDLERAANEAQHKFFREYAGKGTEIEFNYAIDDTKEVSYVIVDKEEYQFLKDHSCNVTLHGMDFTPDQLVDRILELEKLKTPTIENFADEEPSSRRDILRCAEKCVCGHREQDYGSPESNFQLIADLWNQYLFKEPGAKEVFGIGPMDVAMLMALMKISRIRNGGGSGDSFVDLAGYAACGGEIWHSNKETNGDSSQETN